MLETFPEYSYQKCIDIYDRIIENEKMKEYDKGILKKNINNKIENEISDNWNTKKDKQELER
ncbi:hypothetical protein [Streptobacillus moniliformis]|uniref:Uncharacterized protein n=1 Tax=Streptobacillus moniliformis (strain ATCC 14647 / DSM 12112 / NCTC 10651 / 9901) TaxID=519441 RepID=D1AYF9_STRM9|nr:hypothetical protein [Streptobacillus moniliformis]ACZ01335.1 hypothetical protein Smon_0868 [Streptobacillus moniliformis DSM 12112]AVL43646.1 hypothetical protein CEP89_07505 [Streptobacillus moniliformis]SQA13506.1 Uncharacterised protein [Streptobacillus moniliformis]